MNSNAVSSIRPCKEDAVKHTMHYWTQRYHPSSSLQGSVYPIFLCPINALMLTTEPKARKEDGITEHRIARLSTFGFGCHINVSSSILCVLLIHQPNVTAESEEPCIS